jgi:drug/metabolite transporter (DMT)-like permease
MAVAGTRSLLAMLVMITVVRRHDLTLSRTQIVGAICYSANVILFVVSMRLTTAANAILLQYTAPVYVAIGSLFILKERVRISDWIAITIAIFGIALFFFDRLTIQNIYGNLLSILSGIIFAGYIVCMRLQKNTSPIGSAFIGNILTAVICLPFMFGQLPQSKDWVAYHDSDDRAHSESFMGLSLSRGSPGKMGDTRRHHCYFCRLNESQKSERT